MTNRKEFFMDVVFIVGTVLFFLSCAGLVVLLYAGFYLLLNSGADNLEAIARRLL